ncbi:MAG: FtsQ-type POTRA domain-containing protein [Vicinamibacterales bacterium]
MKVSAPADKRFRRAHASPARKHAWLRVSWPKVARAAVVIAIVLFGIYKATGPVLSARALTIGRITVAGNARMSRGEVLSLLEGLQGRSMVTVNLEEWRQRLLTSPWVAEAAIRRVFPGTVAVVVAERQPMGIARIGEQLYLLDERGGVIDEFGPNYAEFDLPIIDGLGVGPKAAGAGQPIDPARAALAVRLMSSLQARPDLAKRVSQIDVSDVRDAAVILRNDTTLVRVGEGQFAERIQSYVDLAPALKERIPSIDYVDLRFGERVYVRPQSSGGLKASGYR